MKNIFKKNQIIITSLAIMIAAAGYLNFSGKDISMVSENQETMVQSVNDDTVDVAVVSQDLSAVSKAQIEDAVCRTCGCDLDQVVITKMKISTDEQNSTN